VPKIETLICTYPPRRQSVKAVLVGSCAYWRHQI